MQTIVDTFDKLNDFANGTLILNKISDSDLSNVLVSLEKQIPKKPIRKEMPYSEEVGFNDEWYCPICGAYVGYFTEGMNEPEQMEYCNECGQHIARDWSEDEEDMNEEKIYPYPLTIIRDRHSGMYAGGTFTAWNREVECIPDEVSGGIFGAIGFWEDYWANYDNITRDFDVIGVGNTPNDAVDDLIRRLQEKDLFIG